MKTLCLYRLAAACPLAKRFIFSTLLVGASLLSLSQDSSTTHSLRSYYKLDLGFQGVGVTFERRSGKITAIDISLGAGGGYDTYGSNFSYQWNLSNPVFFVAANPKVFYNRANRAAKKKRMSFNAGNYIGVRIKYSIPTLTKNTESINLLLFNAHWGMQRTIGKRWTVNGHIGAGYTTRGAATMDTYDASMFYPSADFKFSYNLGKK